MALTSPFQRYLRIVLLVAAITMAVLVGVVLLLLYAAQWTVHPSEQMIADHIRELGGYFRKKPGSGQRIRYVNLDDTEASDRDMAIVLELPLLTHLEIRNTNVTDASIPGIFAHKALSSLGVEGSKMTESKLYRAVRNSNARVSTDIIFTMDEDE